MQKLTFIEKIKLLEKLYTQFEEEVKEFKKNAVCHKGCADCCKQMAKIDLTTLEALRIKEKIETFDESTKLWIKKRLKKDLKKRKKKNYANCPFLTKEDTCLIYEVRPFSCRWIYSLKKCKGNPPLIHSCVFEMAKETIRKIKQLDNNGYSGHISIILQLLDQTEFRESYLLGKPNKIKSFLPYILPNKNK